MSWESKDIVRSPVSQVSVNNINTGGKMFNLSSILSVTLPKSFCLGKPFSVSGSGVTQPWNEDNDHAHTIKLLCGFLS